jgi:hypothetical protein
MSDIRKWLNIMESVPAVFADKSPKEALIKQDATVMLSPKIGGGTARYMNSTPNGAMVDIKGIPRELSEDDFSLPERDYEDPYEKGNEWFHKSANPDTPGTLNDKPEFRAGDMVKIADVYGTGIGPGFGVFVAYGTSGKDCVLSFDSKEIIIPVENIAAVIEQEAKDNFDDVDNDGNLSPMSLGSEIRNMQESKVDKRDEFREWITAVEEALSGKTKNKPELEESAPSAKCGCGSWNCPVCFPDEKSNKKNGIEVDGVPLIDEEDNDFVQKPKSGKGVKLGDIVQKTEVRPTDGHNSPETYGEDNLDGDIDEQDMPMPASSSPSPSSSGSTSMSASSGSLQEIEPDAFGKAGRYSQDHFGNFDEIESDAFDDEGGEEDQMLGLTHDEGPGEYGNDVGFDDNGEGDFDQDQQVVSQVDGEDDLFGGEDTAETVDKIMNIQAMGFSKDDKHYSRGDLLRYTPEELKACYGRVMGDVTESPSDLAEPPDRPKPKPTKTRQSYDDYGDILNPGGSSDLPSEIPGGEDPDAGFNNQGRPMNLPRASRADIQSRLGRMTPTDQMRDFMNRINPEAGGDEPELEPTPNNELTVRTAADVPAVISSALQASGTVNPSWHTISDLPGYMQRNVRGMGRQVFGMFTSTPLENIQTLANVNGQGPNTPAEMRSVASWLMQNAEDLGEVNLSHGAAIPGYEPDVKEYRINGVRFHVVRDPMGQYIYAYPDADARIGNGAPGVGGRGGQLPGQGGGGMPRLREKFILPTPTLLEQLRFDEEMREAWKLVESTLSRLIGKKMGGKALIKWMHKEHKLGNEAELEPIKFDTGLLWTQFKQNPGNFIIVSGGGGVAGIKPSTKHMEKMKKEAEAAGKVYNPAKDNKLPYQTVAFTNDGDRVDPELLRPDPEAPDDDEEGAEPRRRREPEVRDPDPSIYKPRMGNAGVRKDMLNQNNVFNKLNDQIGPLQTIWVSGWSGYRGKHNLHTIGPNTGSVETGKIQKRAERDAPEPINPGGVEQHIFERIKPVFRTLVAQTLSQINGVINRYNKGGNFDKVQEIAPYGAALNKLLVQLDSPEGVKINTNIHNRNNRTKQLSQSLITAISKASNAPFGSEEYKEYAEKAARGSTPDLKAILDGLRVALPNLSNTLE